MSASYNKTTKTGASVKNVVINTSSEINSSLIEHSLLWLYNRILNLDTIELNNSIKQKRHYTKHESNVNRTNVDKE
jgi:hypothetical protein